MSYREILSDLLDKAERSNRPSDEKAKRIAELENELALPPIPAAVVYLWATFIRLHNRRGSNGMGPNPITWADIESFMRLSGVSLAPWEIEIIEDLDGVFFAQQAKKTEK